MYDAKESARPEDWDRKLKKGKSVFNATLNAVSFFLSVTPHFSVASANAVATGAENLTMNLAQFGMLELQMKRAETALCATSLGAGSHKKLLVITIRATLLS